MKKLIGTSLAFLAITASPALAYVGPGLGLGTIMVVLGLIGSVFLAIVAVVWYPLKRLLRSRKKGSTGKFEPDNSAQHD